MEVDENCAGELKMNNEQMILYHKTLRLEMNLNELIFILPGIFIICICLKTCLLTIGMPEHQGAWDRAVCGKFCLPMPASKRSDLDLIHIFLKNKSYFGRCNIIAYGKYGTLGHQFERCPAQQELKTVLTYCMLSHPFSFSSHTTNFPPHYTNGLWRFSVGCELLRM